MEIRKKYLVIIVIFLISAVFAASFSYFGVKVIKDEINPTNVSTGSLNVKISDEIVNVSSLAPIYDKNYLNKAYKKEFTINNISETLNSCTSLYLDIKEISDSLKSEYFKYLLISSDGKTYSGDFRSAKSGEKLLLENGIFLETKNSISYTLYIWISYAEGINQIGMLNTTMSASVVINSNDMKNLQSCDKSLYDTIVNDNNVKNNDNIYYLENKYVMFSNICFKILRTNTDGSIRLMYNGTDCLNNSVINNVSLTNVNYLESNIKNEIDNWYVTNIISNGSDVTSRVVDSGFCNIDNSECYSISKMNGNGLLNYPVGTLTYNDVLLTGIKSETDIWLMDKYSDSEVYVLNSELTYKSINNSCGVVPVISIKKDTNILSGNGSKEEPYVLK